MGANVLPFRPLGESQEQSDCVTFDANEIQKMVAALDVAAVAIVRDCLNKQGKTICDKELALHSKTLLHSAFLQKSSRRT